MSRTRQRGLAAGRRGLVTEWSGLVARWRSLVTEWSGLVARWRSLVAAWLGLVAGRRGLVTEWSGLVARWRSLVTEWSGLVAGWRSLVGLVLLLGVACSRPVSPLPVAPQPSPTPAPPVALPRDAGPHDALTEWWYFTGHLRSDRDGSLYGFEFTVFQVQRQGAPTGYLAHFAVSDIGGQRFSHQARTAQRDPAGGPPSPAAAHQPNGVTSQAPSPGASPGDASGAAPGASSGASAFALDVSGWSLSADGAADVIAADMQAGPGADPPFGLRLRLVDEKPAALHHGGYIDYGIAGGSYYYSRTRLQVSGVLRRAQAEQSGQTQAEQSAQARPEQSGQAQAERSGQTQAEPSGQTQDVASGQAQAEPSGQTQDVASGQAQAEQSGQAQADWGDEPVSGVAWMDHQWGNFVVAAVGGWDWYSVQLDDRSELMLYVLRAPSGETTGVYGTQVLADGTTRDLGPGTVRTTALGTWLSPHTGAAYPSGWRLNLPGGEQLELRPQLLDQELYFPGLDAAVPGASVPAYWEGAVTVAGDRTGVGYVELTGYAAR